MTERTPVRLFTDGNRDDALEAIGDDVEERGGLDYYDGPSPGGDERDAAGGEP